LVALTSCSQGRFYLSHRSIPNGKNAVPSRGKRSSLLDNSNDPTTAKRSVREGRFWRKITVNEHLRPSHAKRTSLSCCLRPCTPHRSDCKPAEINLHAPRRHILVNEKLSMYSCRRAAGQRGPPLVSVRVRVRHGYGRGTKRRLSAVRSQRAVVGLVCRRRKRRSGSTWRVRRQGVRPESTWIRVQAQVQVRVLADIRYLGRGGRAGRGATGEWERCDSISRNFACMRLSVF
jgi:hypothetical protein